MRLPQNAPSVQVLGTWRKKDLMLLFHPDKKQLHEDDILEALRQLGKRGDPAEAGRELVGEAFRRVNDAKDLPRTSVPGPAASPAPAARRPSGGGPAPPPLQAFYVDIVPTVGDFGFDLIVSFRMGRGLSAQVQEVVVSMMKAGAMPQDWQATTFFNEGTQGELLIQNQSLVDKLGRRGIAKSITVFACTASPRQVRSHALQLQIDLKTYTAKTRIYGEMK
jgi:hypothetical protein